MRPLTERWPKPLLPIDGRPVIATLLRELALAGFESVTIVVGHLADRIEALVGDGSGFALDVRYTDQPRALGAGDAVRRALAAGVRPPLVATAADTVYAPGDVARACRAWLASGAAGGLGVREVPPAEVDGRTAVTVESGWVTAIGGQAKRRRGSVVAAAPLWFLGPDLASALDAVPGPPHELAAPFRAAIAAGAKILAVELGPTRDVTTPHDVVLRNFPYLSR